MRPWPCTGDGHLADLGGLAGLARFPPAAKRPWQTDDGSATFCVPVASVIHGFVYNRDAFRELGIGPPETEAEFFAALERIREDGARIPLALGLRDRWEAAVMGYDNIGPAYWKGEEGRRALIEGRQKLTDEPWSHRSGRWRSGAVISATGTGRAATGTAGTSSSGAGRRCIPPGAGKSPVCGNPVPGSAWAPSVRRCPVPGTPATSPTTWTWGSA